jgi:hypothetical protein
VAPGGSCTISVTFTPKRRGSNAATLDVRDDGGASPQTVALTGTGKLTLFKPISLRISLSPTAHVAPRQSSCRALADIVRFKIVDYGPKMYVAPGP